MLPPTATGPTLRPHEARGAQAKALHAAAKPADKAELPDTPAEAPAEQPMPPRKAQPVKHTKAKVKVKEKARAKERVKGSTGKGRSTPAYRPPPHAALDYQLVSGENGVPGKTVFGIKTSA